MGPGAWIFMGLFWIALIALIIWLVFQLVPSNGRSLAEPPASRSAAPESPIEVLDRRLAQGEIDLETYKAHRSALVAARGGS